jgi:hypothetical protein
MLKGRYINLIAYEKVIMRDFMMIKPYLCNTIIEKSYKQARA